MLEYLTFNKFIAQDILIFSYYFGAIVMPIFFWYIRTYIIRKVLLIKEIENFINGYYLQLSLKNKMKIIFGFIMMFLCAQVCWRMIFEAMIGYFDMHNYLYEISQSLKIKNQ